MKLGSRNSCEIHGCDKNVAAKEPLSVLMSIQELTTLAMAVARAAMASSHQGPVSKAIDRTASPA
jgi:hypothetical protein